MTNDQNVFQTTSDYDTYQVVDMIYDGRPARLLYSGNRAAAQSGLATDGKSELLFDYNERFMELVRGRKPARILLIGGGACTLPKAINEEFRHVELDVVELDPALIGIATTYFGFESNEHTHIYIGDGAKMLQVGGELAAKKYDLILLDAFKHAEIPDVFRTEASAQAFRGHLTKTGMFAMNIIGTYNGTRATQLQAQTTTLQAVFPHIGLFPADNDISLWISQNFIVTAQQGAQDLNEYLRYESLNLP